MSAPLNLLRLADAIRYEDQVLVVVDKPAGLPTSGRRLNDPDCLQYALMQRHVAMVWAVHQLDADTSGLNVFVTRREAVPLWQQRLRYPEAVKRYLAVVDGHPRAQRIDAPIGVVRAEPSTCLGVSAAGRQARTQLRVLARGPAASLCELILETGRTHQIRIHLQHIGHALLGEAWYRAQPCRRHHRQALHAAAIDFAAGVAPRTLQAQLPSDLRALLLREGIAWPAGDSVEEG